MNSKQPDLPKSIVPKSADDAVADKSKTVDHVDKKVNVDSEVQKMEPIIAAAPLTAAAAAAAAKVGPES